MAGPSFRAGSLSTSRTTIPSNSDFWNVYERGSYQNMSVFGTHYSYMQPGRYLYRLAPHGFDTRALKDGVYDLVVTATDIRGNSTAESLGSRCTTAAAGTARRCGSDRGGRSAFYSCRRARRGQDAHMREFRILGPLEVLLDGRPVELGGQRQRALLAALLVHHGQVVSTERLVDLVWGESAPKTATTSLQNAVAQLRRVLGADVLETRAPGYVLAAEADADRRRSLRDPSRAGTAAPGGGAGELLRSALALWRGPALADLAGEEFTQGEIRRLEELRLDALEERIDADIEFGLHREVIGELETLAAVAPLRERVCALRMLALYRSGRQAEALQAFRDTRTAFVEQLGIEPGASSRNCTRGSCARRRGSWRPGTGRRGRGGGRDSPGGVRGRVVPVLGLVGSAELAQRLASTFDVPGDVTAPRARHPVRRGDAGSRAAARRAPRSSAARIEPRRRAPAACPPTRLAARA